MGTGASGGFGHRTAGPARRAVARCGAVPGLGHRPVDRGARGDGSAEARAPTVAREPLG